MLYDTIIRGTIINHFFIVHNIIAIKLLITVKCILKSQTLKTAILSDRHPLMWVENVTRDLQITHIGYLFYHKLKIISYSNLELTKISRYNIYIIRYITEQNAIKDEI